MQNYKFIYNFFWLSFLFLSNEKKKKTGNRADLFPPSTYLSSPHHWCCACRVPLQTHAGCKFTNLFTFSRLTICVHIAIFVHNIKKSLLPRGQFTCAIYICDQLWASLKQIQLQLVQIPVRNPDNCVSVPRFGYKFVIFNFPNHFSKSNYRDFQLQRFSKLYFLNNDKKLLPRSALSTHTFIQRRFLRSKLIFKAKNCTGFGYVLLQVNCTHRDPQHETQVEGRLRYQKHCTPKPWPCFCLDFCESTRKSNTKSQS